MSVKILMPALSPTMSEGNLTKWLIKEGDIVKAGDVLAEIETDKATMEVEAVDEGVIEKLLFNEGEQSIAVNSPIAILSDVKNEINENKTQVKSLETRTKKEENSENKKQEKKENKENKENIQDKNQND
ncbi:uncharacterized protein METZ01_LOCUS390578, partial [marine metagenome]